MESRDDSSLSLVSLLHAELQASCSVTHRRRSGAGQAHGKTTTITSGAWSRPGVGSGPVVGSVEVWRSGGECMRRLRVKCWVAVAVQVLVW